MEAEKGESVSGVAVQQKKRRQKNVTKHKLVMIREMTASTKVVQKTKLCATSVPRTLNLQIYCLTGHVATDTQKHRITNWHKAH